MKYMEKATKTFENYIDFWVRFHPSVSDKILFCVSLGLESPKALMQKLQIAKGNLTNYCKALIKGGELTKQVHGRTVRYALTTKGQASVKKFLEAVGKDASI